MSRNESVVLILKNYKKKRNEIYQSIKDIKNDTRLANRYIDELTDKKKKEVETLSNEVYSEVVQIIDSAINEIKNLTKKNQSKGLEYLMTVNNIYQIIDSVGSDLKASDIENLIAPIVAAKDFMNLRAIYNKLLNNGVDYDLVINAVPIIGIDKEIDKFESIKFNLSKTLNETDSIPFEFSVDRIITSLENRNIDLDINGENGYMNSNIDE